jgi:type I restriction enzyme, S subunit
MNDQTPTSLGELLKAFGGSLKTGPFGTTLKAAEYSKLRGVPIISVGEIGYGALRVGKSTPRVDDDVLRRLPEYILRPGDIVFGRKGAVDRCALVRENEGGYFLGSDGIRLRLGTGIDPEFLAYQFQSSRVRNWLISNSSGTTMASLNQEILGRVLVNLPKLPEQRRAAEALNAADGLIATLEHLIAKKQAIKQGMMQQLLTGLTRFPNFAIAWHKVSLGAISAFITKGATPTTYGFKWESTGVPFLRSECVSAHGLDLTQSMFISSAADLALRRSQVIDGDILMTITGYVGRVVRLAGIGRANINQHIARIRIRDQQFDSDYVYHYLAQRAMREYYDSIVTGQAYPQISLKQVRDTEIPAPPIEEQRAIASALGDADAELAALDERLSKARAIKTGMMQQLLTGRTRLPVEAVS